MTLRTLFGVLKAFVTKYNKLEVQGLRWAFLTPLGWNLFDWACAGPYNLGPRVPDLRSNTRKESNGEILTCCVQGPDDVIC